MSGLGPRANLTGLLADIRLSIKLINRTAQLSGPFCARNQTFRRQN